MLSDLLITIAGFFIFDIKTGLYSLLGLTIRSFMVDTFIENFNRKRKICYAAHESLAPNDRCKRFALCLV